jgi:hypothetical protein
VSVEHVFSWWHSCDIHELANGSIHRSLVKNKFKLNCDCGCVHRSFCGDEDGNDAKKKKHVLFLFAYVKVYSSLVSDAASLFPVTDLSPMFSHL